MHNACLEIIAFPKVDITVVTILTTVISTAVIYFKY